MVGLPILALRRREDKAEVEAFVYRSLQATTLGHQSVLAARSLAELEFTFCLSCRTVKSAHLYKAVCAVSESSANLTVYCVVLF